MKEKHSGWANKLPVIEKCINATHHNTIEMTPYEAQFGKKPTRSW